MRRLGWVAVYLLCLSFPDIGIAQTFACSDGFSGQPKRWYLPASSNLADKAPDQCATCAESVNQDHPSCAVYRILRSEDCSDGRCANEQGDFVLNWRDGYAVQQSLRYQSPFKFILDAGSNCWFLVWALDPVTGVEHTDARDEVNYWQVGFKAATSIVSPPIPELELGMMIQPAHRRSQHQLHIHVGRIQQRYREAIDELPSNSSSVHELRVGAHHFVARYLPDLPDKKPLEGYRLFGEVASMVPGGESSMPLHGVMVVRDKWRAGSWVLAAQGLTRRELVVSQAQACQLGD